MTNFFATQKPLLKIQCSLLRIAHLKVLFSTQDIVNAVDKNYETCNLVADCWH